MFAHHRDPDATGVGVAFTNAALDLADGAEPRARAAAFARLSDALGVPVAIVRQVHGDVVLDVDGPGPDVGAWVQPGEADALVTTRRGVGVAVRVADCVPVLLADAAGTVVGAVHAGRDGLLKGVIGRAVERVAELGTGGVRAWIGPHICGACYEVPDAMALDAAERLGVGVTRTRWGTLGIDLGAAARHQLEVAGASWESWEDCTLTDESLHSHRRGSAGRQLGVAWLTAGD